jgi:hypothetical protein
MMTPMLLRKKRCFQHQESPNAGAVEATQTQEEEENPFDVPGNRRLVAAAANLSIEMLVPAFYNAEIEMAIVKQRKIANANLGASIKKFKSPNVAKKFNKRLMKRKVSSLKTWKPLSHCKQMRSGIRNKKRFSKNHKKTI